MRVIRTIALFVVVGFFSTFSAIAQYWPIPASTPAVDVKCAGCIGGKNNLLTPGYPATLSGFTGRFLDSQATQDIQQPFRTSRAFYVYPARSRGRIYMIIGSAVFAYDISTFFTRLAGNESLVYANTVPVTNPGNWGLRNGTVMDKFLRWDSFFYAENENNGWITPVNDGQERLFWLDYDDQGYVYLAYSVFGWGIVKDDGTNSGNIMQSVYQNTENAFDTVNPFAIMSVKSSTGHYYALVGGGSTVWNVFDVSNRSAPIRQSSISRGILSFSKNGTSDRIAIVTSDRSKVQIFTSDALVVGGAPLVEFTAPGGNLFKSVTSDGTNFYADASASAGTTISTFAPSGSTYTRTDYTVSRSDLNALKYGDGYLLSIANTNGAGNLIIYKLVGGAPVEIPTADYFQRYYISNPDSHYVTPSFHSFYDSTIMKSGTKVYLIATAYSLGDVYELPSTDSVSVTNLGASGTINSSRPTDSGVGPFYGDPVAFKATTGAATPMNVQWDFGNPEASASADPNAATGITGTTITHRYSGVTSASLLPITRTVRATNTSDSSITSTVSVALQKPTARFGVGNYKFLFVQPNASSPAPIVAGDKFFDASDGMVESHYNTWSIDSAAAVRSVPPGAVDVGACGQHTLSYDAHYGPYSTTPSIASLGPDMPIGIHGSGFDFVYGVRPFAPAIDVTSDSASVTFKSLTRVSGDTNALSPPQAAGLSYRWELLDANNAVIAADSGGSGPVQSFHDFVVSKTVFGGRRNVRAHLIVTAVNGVGASCASFTSAEAFTSPMSAPDPRIDGACTGGGPPCNYTAGSLSNVNQTSDGWSYLWSVTGPAAPSFSSNTGTTFSPIFTQTGTYTINLAVTNNITTTTATKTEVVTTAGSTCQTMTPGNVFISYHNASNGCTQSFGTCGVGEALTFTGTGFNYDFGCATHTFVWNFGDATSSVSGQQLSHSFAAGGTFNVQLTIANPGQSITVTQSVPVGGFTPPPTPPTPPSTPPPTPPSTPPPTPTGCPFMSSNNVFITFQGANSGCSQVGGTCAAGEQVTLAVAGFGYDFSCANHTYSWSFGGSGKSLTHTFSSSTAVSVTVSNGSQNFVATVNVPVSGSAPPTPPTPTPPTPTPPTPPPTGNCSPVIPDVTLFVTYAGPQSGCTHLSGDCNTVETVPFTLQGFNYDFNCATHSFQWDFGDSSAAGSGRTVNHRYVFAGAYNLTVTVSVNGQAYLVRQKVTVSGQSPAQPPPTSGTYPFDFSAQAIVGVPNGYIFTAFASGSTSSAGATYTWDFGDGHTDTTTALTTSHIYADNKNYTVTLSVSGYPGSVQHAAVGRRRSSHH